MLPAAMVASSVVGAASSALNKGSGASTSAQNLNRTTSVNYPSWYNNYTQGVLDRAQTAANTPYESYDSSKLFEPFSADQTAAGDRIRAAQGNVDPLFGSGKGALDAVSGRDSLASAQPFLDQAGNSIRPWDAGAGALSMAGRDWTDPNVQAAYQNPYLAGAINRGNQLATRGFDETLNGLNSRFASGYGAIGRTGYNTSMQKALRTFGNEMSGNDLTQTSNDYFKNAGQFNADRSNWQNLGLNLANVADTNMKANTNLADAYSRITTGSINNGINLANSYGALGTSYNNVQNANNKALMDWGTAQQTQGQLPRTFAYNDWLAQKQYPFQMANFLANVQAPFKIPTTTTEQSTQTGTGSSSNTPSTLGTIMGGLTAANAVGAKDGVGGIENLYNAASDTFGGPNGFTGPNYTSLNNPYTAAGIATSGAGVAPTIVQAGAARGGMIRRYAQGGTAFGPIVEPRGVLSRRARGFPVNATPRPYARGGAVSRYDVGGSVPVERGMMMMNSRPPMPPPGMGVLPQGMAPPGVFSGGGGGGGMPMMPPPGALNMMR
jgi:hypothetical protein